jgi:hypothetical protein
MKNPNHQFPNPKEIPTTKAQTTTPGRLRFESWGFLGAGRLGFED